MIKQNTYTCYALATLLSHDPEQRGIIRDLATRQLGIISQSEFTSLITQYDIQSEQELNNLVNKTINRLFENKKKIYTA